MVLNLGARRRAGGGGCLRTPCLMSLEISPQPGGPAGVSSAPARRRRAKRRKVRRARGGGKAWRSGSKENGPRGERRTFDRPHRLLDSRHHRTHSHPALLLFGRFASGMYRRPRTLSLGTTMSGLDGVERHQVLRPGPGARRRVVVELGEGEPLALLGRNGPCKTTLIRAITCRVRLHGGEVRLFAGGVRPAGHTPQELGVVRRTSRSIRRRPRARPLRLRLVSRPVRPRAPGPAGRLGRSSRPGSPTARPSRSNSPRAGAASAR